MTMNKKAFTLVELGIVAIIVGVLVLVGIPNMLKSINRNYALDAMRNLMNIYTAQHKYAQEQSGAYTGFCDNACLRTTLELNIVPTGGTTYTCGDFAGTFACAAQNTNFTIMIDPDIPIIPQSTPVYCNGSMPSNTYNPCCVQTAGHNPGDQCP